MPATLTYVCHVGVGFPGFSGHVGVFVRLFRISRDLRRLNDYGGALDCRRSQVARYLCLCKFASSVDHFLDAFHFEAAEERFRHRVDAPMSSVGYCVRQIRQDQWIQLANDIAFKTALDFFCRETFGGASRHVGSSPRFAAHTNEGYCP